MSTGVSPSESGCLSVTFPNKDSKGSYMKRRGTAPANRLLEGKKMKSQDWLARPENQSQPALSQLPRPTKQSRPETPIKTRALRNGTHQNSTPQSLVSHASSCLPLTGTSRRCGSQSGSQTGRCASGIQRLYLHNVHDNKEHHTTKVSAC
jgi:hypothetical protein